MKTTIDLPEQLVRQLKLRAVHERRKLKDLAADYLRQGLMSTQPESREISIAVNKKTGLPVIQCPRQSGCAAHLTPDQVAEILNDQEISWR